MIVSILARYVLQFSKRGYQNLRWCQELVLNRKRLNVQVHILDLLIAVELVGLANAIQQLEDRSLDTGVVGGLLELLEVVRGNVLLEYPAGVGREGDGVDAEDGHQAALLGVAVHERHGDQVGAGHVHVLDALRGDVLALGQLEHVLLAVDNLEPAQAVDLNDVARVEPAVRIHRLGGLLRVLVVFLEHDGTAHEQLAARVRLVFDRVVVVRHGLDAEFDRGARGADVAGGEIAGNLDSAGGVRLGHAETLDKIVTEGGTEELVHVGVKLGGATDHGAGAVETDALENLLGPDAVVQEVLVGSLAVGKGHALLLGLHNVAGESALETVGVDGRGLNSAVDAVVQARDGHKAGRAQDLHILDQASDVAVEITDAGALSQSGLVGHATVDMRQGKVGDVNVGGENALVRAGGSNTGHTLSVGDQDTLGVASGARGIVDGENILTLGGLHGEARLDTERLNLIDGEDLDAHTAGGGIEELALGVASGLTSIQRVQGDDELQGRATRRKLEESRDMGHRACNGSKAAVVDDVLGGLGSESLVKRDGEQGLGDERKLCDAVSILHVHNMCRAHLVKKYVPVICHSGRFCAHKPTPYFSSVKPMDLWRATIPAPKFFLRSATSL